MYGELYNCKLGCVDNLQIADKNKHYLSHITATAHIIRVFPGFQMSTVHIIAHFCLDRYFKGRKHTQKVIHCPSSLAG